MQIAPMLLLTLLSNLSLTGCGTLYTVVLDDENTQEHLSNAKSYCGAIPRVYSGVMFDFCTLYAPPQTELDPHVGSAPPIFMVGDMVFSGLLDTLVLPYTLYRQRSDGNIEIVRTPMKKAGT